MEWLTERKQKTGRSSKMGPKGNEKKHTTDAMSR
jgi:hypothetical protein